MEDNLPPGVSTFKHPLPRSERKRRKSGSAVGGMSSNAKATRTFGNEANRNFYCHPHAYRLDPERYARLSAMAWAAHKMKGPGG